MRIIIVITATVMLAAVGVAVAGARGSGAGTVDVVAAENVYGDITQQIGGGHVSVTSILSDPNADPHLYEPGTRAGLAVANARLVIQNGLGYDAFMQKLEAASPSSSRVVVTVADALGIRGAGANPHVWYDIPRLGVIAKTIAGGLARVDPAHASDYAAGRRRFIARTAELQQAVASIRTHFRGLPVAYTEPVPGYLLAAAGLRNLAPEQFTRAIEDGSEPSPAAVAQMTALLVHRRVDVLLYNDQTVSPITQRIRDAARAHRVPVVGVSETLPPGLDFQQWQLGQVRALRAALAR
jgi:zinc/manganese transport system substrate-binding protein